MTGSATNAEDFTKQFMSEMFGNNGAGNFLVLFFLKMTQINTRFQGIDFNLQLKVVNI